MAVAAVSHHSAPLTWRPRFLCLGFLVSKAMTASTAAPSASFLELGATKEGRGGGEGRGAERCPVAGGRESRLLLFLGT